MAIIQVAKEPEYAPENYVVLQEFQVDVTSRTHAYFLGFSENIQQIALRLFRPEVNYSYLLTINSLLQQWGKVYEGYKIELEIDRWKGGAIGGATLPELHNSYLVPMASEVLEQRATTGLTYMDNLIRDMLEESLERVYPDELTLSDRIRRLDANSRQKLRQLVLAAGAQGTSAVDLAKELEEFAGANELCVQLQIGCVESGVTYQALRLARTEIQYMHSLVSQEVYRRLPFVEAYTWRISANHRYPQNCVCESNDGRTYELGKGPIPPGHSNCKCYTTAVLQDRDVFVGRLRDWMGGGTDPGLDEYQSWLNLDSKAEIFKPIEYNLENIPKI